VSSLVSSIVRSFVRSFDRSIDEAGVQRGWTLCVSFFLLDAARLSRALEVFVEGDGWGRGPVVEEGGAVDAAEGRRGADEDGVVGRFP